MQPTLVDDNDQFRSETSHTGVFNYHKGGSYVCNASENLHCNDGPAVVYNDGEEHWWHNGVRHRVGGPAIARNNCALWWFVDGTFIHNNKDYQRATGMSDEDMLVMVLKYGDVR